MDNQEYNSIVSFIWGIADDCLRDVYVRGKYRDVILPMTVIRRLDAMLEGTKKAVLTMKKQLDTAKIDNQWPALCNTAGQAFCNASPFLLKDLTSRAKKQTLEADFKAYLDGFSPNVQEILDKFKFRDQIKTMVDADNLSNLESVRNAFREAASKYGCIDILVNNAGVSESTPFTEYTEETFDKVMDLNVKGVFNATRAASECMIAKGQGVILSTSSMVSIYGQPSGFAYPASKFAVNGLTVSLARELGPKGIRVNAVAPGITLTDMMKVVPKEVIDPLIKQIPLRRLGQPEDIANAFVFLASDEASYITGVVLSVDGMART